MRNINWKLNWVGFKELMSRSLQVSKHTGNKAIVTLDVVFI